MKRILSAMMAMLMLLPLTSCASDSSADAETSANTSAAETTAGETIAEEDPYLHDSLGEYDFNGAEYIVFGASNRTTTAVTAAEENGEAINDAQYKSRLLVEERFDVKIRYEDIGTGDGDVFTMMRQLVSGGDDTYAIGVGQDANTINLSTQGFHYNLHSIPQFDFDQLWWGDATKELAIGDKYYAASSFLTYYCLYYARMLVVNKDLAADLKLTIPYEKVFAGEWYLDDYAAFIANANRDLNGDGAMTDADQYGFSYQNGTLYTFQSSLGIEAFEKDEKNVPFVAFPLEKAQTYLSKMEKLLTGSAIKTSENYGVPFFTKGNTLTVYCCLREVCNIIRETDISYGFLPAPKLDENQKEYKTVNTDVLWAVPAIHKAKLEMIGAVTEALSCQHYNYVRPAFFDTTMKGKLSESPNDAAVLDLIPATRSLDCAFSYNLVLKPMATLKDLTNTVTSGNLASTYQSLAGALEAELKLLKENIEKLPG